MIKQTVLSLVLCGAGLLSACGFEPVHRPGLTEGSSTVQISEIEGRTGHALRKALLQETASGIPGADYANITVTIRESLDRIGFNGDGAATRSSITLRGRYFVDFGEDAISGQEQATVYYSVPDSPYGDISAQIDAADQAAVVLAREIVDDIILQMSRR